MARKYFKWTPEATERFRRMAKTMRRAQMAAELGCTVSAVHTKLRDLGIRRRKKNAPAQIKAYMDRYNVTYDKVQQFGVERLDKMGEEARAIMLHYKDTRGRPRSSSRREPKENMVRIERMMTLVATRARLLTWQKRKAA